METTEDIDETKPIRCCCTFCGKVYGKAVFTKAEATEIGLKHIRECPDHPLSKALAVNADLIEALEFYMTICGNTAHQVSAATAAQMYAKGKAAVAKATGQTLAD